MIKAQIVSYWVAGEDGLSPHFVGMVEGDSWVDVTAQAIVPSAPNSVVMECEISEATFAAIEEDDGLYVLWDAPNPKQPDGVPSAADF